MGWSKGVPEGSSRGDVVNRLARTETSLYDRAVSKLRPPQTIPLEAPGSALFGALVAVSAAAAFGCAVPGCKAPSPGSETSATLVESATGTPGEASGSGAAGTPTSAGSPGGAFAPTGTPAGTARPLLFVPMSGPGPFPVVVLLHPYGGIAERMAAFYGVAQAAEREGWIVAIPRGDVDARGMPYWNATDACCDRDRAEVDHLAGLRRLVGELVQRPDADPSRVVLVGASNGAFMSYRLACEAAELVTGVVAIAGAEWQDESRCAPALPVSVLHVHAADDSVIAFDGAADSPLDGTRGAGYPGADEVARRWASRNGCAEMAAERPSEIGAGVARRWPECALGTSVELHALESGGHVLTPSPAITAAIAEFVRDAARNRPGLDSR